MSTEQMTLALVAGMLVITDIVVAFDSMSQQGVWKRGKALACRTIVKSGAALGIHSYRYVGRH